MKTWFSVMALASVVALAASGRTRADQVQVFDFNDLTPSTSGFEALTGLAVPAGYGGHGLNWTNFNYVAPTVFSGITSGYGSIGSSYGNVANNLGGDAASLTISGAELFTFNSVDLKAAWDDGMTITMVGSLGGTQEYSTSATVGTSGWNSFANAYAGTNVDSLTFTVTDPGTSITQGSAPVTIFIMDNLTLGFRSAFTPDAVAVPEPSSVISAAVAVAAGLGLGARRRRRPA